MANTLLTNVAITTRAIAILENTLVFARQINREYAGMFMDKNSQNGQTINIRVPPRYTTILGQAADVQGTQETYVPLTLFQRNASVSFSMLDMTLNINAYSRNFMEPILSQLSNDIDLDGLKLAYQVWNAVGTPGVAITDPSVVLTAGALLDSWACPRDKNRKVVIDPITNASLATSVRAFYNPNQVISKIFENGLVARDFYGFDFYVSQNVVKLRHGVFTGTPLVNQAVPLTNGATSIITDAWTAGDVLKAGQIISFAGVNGLNPQARQDNGFAMQVVLTADATANGSGQMTINFAPALYGPNPDGSVTQQQNVTALPADDAAITVFGASGVLETMNLAFHRDAFSMAFVDIHELYQTDGKYVKAPNLGVGVLVSKAGNIQGGYNILRYDVLYGYCMLRGEYACRLAA